MGPILPTLTSATRQPTMTSPQLLTQAEAAARQTAANHAALRIAQRRAAQRWEASQAISQAWQRQEARAQR